MKVRKNRGMAYVILPRDKVTTELFDQAYDAVDKHIKRLPKVETQEDTVHLWGVNKHFNND